MKVESKELGKQHEKITITITPEDYSQKFESELKKYQQKGQIKGFRKGKTPLDIVKKMYGPSLFPEIVFNEVNKSFQDHLTESGKNLFAEPIMVASEDNPNLDFKVNNEYSFSFEIGLLPDFKIEEPTWKESMTRPSIKITESMIEEGIEDLRRRFAKQEEVEGPIESGDFVEFTGNELDSKGKIKNDGLEIRPTIYVDDIADENLKSQLLGKSLGFELEINFKTALGEKEDSFLRKNIFSLDEGDEREVGYAYNCKVEKINRRIPADLNEEFFKQVVGNEEPTLEKLKELFTEHLKNNYEGDINFFLLDSLIKKSLDENQYGLPQEFFKKYVQQNTPDFKEEEFDQQYESTEKYFINTHFLKFLGKHYQCDNISKTDVVNHLVQSFKYNQGLGNIPEDILYQVAENSIKEERTYEEHYFNILKTRLAFVLSKNIDWTIQEVSEEDFKKMKEELYPKTSNEPLIEQ
jgi:trigger factor